MHFAATIIFLKSGIEVIDVLDTSMVEVHRNRPAIAPQNLEIIRIRNVTEVLPIFIYHV